MKISDEAALEKFTDWLKKAKKKNLLQPARPEDHFENITPKHYSTALFYVHFNELLRKEPGFEGAEQEAFKKFVETYPEVYPEFYPGKAPLKFAFPSDFHYKWGGVNRRLFRPFMRVLTKKDLVIGWKGEEREVISGERFNKALWEWFFYELVRRGKVDDVRRKDELYRKRYTSSIQ